MKTIANDLLKEFKPELSGSLQKDLKALERETLEYAGINVKPEMFRQYKTVLNNFISFTGNKPLNEINKNNIINYIRYREGCNSKFGRAFSASALNLELSVLKKTFEIAIDIKWLSFNPARSIKKIPVTERVPEYSLNEIKLILNELKQLPDLRYYQAVLIALNTGLRRGEIANLNWKQIDMHNWEIHLKNKINKKPEFVGFNQVVYDIFSELQKIQSFDGNIWNGLSPNYLYEVVKKINRKLGLNPKLRFHSLRHTFVTEVVNKYGIHIGKDLARHYDISMTAAYYHSNRNAIKEKAKAIIIN